MVGAVAGAGMRGGGSLNIRGSLDTSNIERGFSRVKSGFQGVKGQASSFSSDLVRMASVAGDLAKRLGVLAIAGGGAMVALASKSPAVAPALAKMQVEFGKLTRTLGQALAPAFERVGGWFEKFVGWVGDNQGTITEVTGHMLDFAESVGVKLAPALEKVSGWASENPKLFAGILSGLILSPAIIKGIGMIKGLVSVLSGSLISKGVIALMSSPIFWAGLAGVGAGALVWATAKAVSTPPETASVPLTPQAQMQIQNAKGNQLLDLQNTYAWNPYGASPFQQTAEFGADGMLMTPQRRFELMAQEWARELVQGHDRKFMLLNQSDYFRG